MPKTAPATHELILDVVRRIPAGCVASYGQVAEEAGLPGRARLVGHLLRTLPCGADVPWQRVVNARGCVSPRSEFPGDANRQLRLLKAEGVRMDDKGKIDLARFGWNPALPGSEDEAAFGTRRILCAVQL